MQLWQRMVRRWSLLVFGERYTDITPKIRVLRVLEEAAELAQAEGVTEDEFDHIKRQVFSNPPGERHEELGAVLICLAGYASTIDADLEQSFWNEFERIMDPAIIEKVRKRNLEGDKIGFVKKPLIVLGKEEGERLVIRDTAAGLEFVKYNSDTSSSAEDWIPIDQFKHEIDGFTAEVLVNNQIIEGHYQCGHTWGWADIDGVWISPTHFRFRASPIAGMETLAASIDKATKVTD